VVSFWVFSAGIEEVSTQMRKSPAAAAAGEAIVEEHINDLIAIIARRLFAISAGSFWVFSAGIEEVRT
jgi:hypothetical protein